MLPIQFNAVPEQVLVTGGTGFVGKHLVKALLRDGHQVTVLTRNPAMAKRLLGDAVRCIDSLEQLAATDTIDVVINLAGARILGWRWTAARQQVLRESRITLTQRLVQWMARAEHKPKVLLSASAIGYYGVQAQNDPQVLSEDSPPQPVFMSELCQEWEAAARQACAYGVPVRCLRFGVVLGDEGALPQMLLPIRLGLGGPLAGGQQCLSWIHVQDLLRAMADVRQGVTAAEPDFIAFNFTAPQPVTQQQFAHTAAAILHRPAWMPTPGLPLRCLLGEQADLLLEGQRVMPTRLLAQGFQFEYPTLQVALENLLNSH